MLSLVEHAEAPWWAWIARQCNSLGYIARQSPLKMLVLILNVVGAIDGLDLELQELLRPGRIEGTTEHVTIGTSVGTVLIEVCDAADSLPATTPSQPKVSTSPGP